MFTIIFTDLCNDANGTLSCEFSAGSWVSSFLLRPFLLEVWTSKEGQRDGVNAKERDIKSEVSKEQCDQKKLPNVYKSCPKIISLEKW